MLVTLQIDMEFFDYFEELFAERWPTLLESLKGEGCATKLQFADTLEPYFLDEASVFAANALGVEPGMDVLDMCAAPGGKSLVIARARERSSAMTVLRIGVSVCSMFWKIPCRNRGVRL